MIGKVLEAIENMVQEVHTNDQAKVPECYLAFIDAIAGFIEDMANRGYTVDLSGDLQKIQNAMTKKDYIEVSDLLLYEIRPDFVQLEKDLAAV